MVGIFLKTRRVTREIRLHTSQGFFGCKIELQTCADFPEDVVPFPKSSLHYLIETLYLIDHFNSQNSDGIIVVIDYRLIHHIFGKQKIYKIGKKRNCPTEISAKIISKKISHRLLTVLFFRTSC